MSWQLIVAASLTYYIGAVITLRKGVLRMRRKYGENWRHDLDEDGFPPHVLGIGIMVLFWPLVAIVVGTWKLAFPFQGDGPRAWIQRRRSAKADKKLRLEQERERAILQLRREQEEAYQAALKVLATLVSDQAAIEAAAPETPVMGRSVAEAEFTQFSEQVWRDRGKPWHLSPTLQKIRVRHQRAKEAANA